MRTSAVAVYDVGNAFGAKAVAGFVDAYNCNSDQLRFYTVITPLSQQSIVFVFGTQRRQKNSNQAFAKRDSLTPEIGKSFAFSAVLCLVTEDGSTSLPIGITNIPLGS